MVKTAVQYDSEKKSLEAHVDLCAERYYRLEQRLEGVETAVNGLKVTMIDESKRTSKIIIGSAATVIGGLMSTMVALVMMN
jgi:hypothetical protein|tara:strand:+ start:941 stop:1183 length:243 start_codon:yes stop_codon:yes gene_type:complete